MEDATQQQHSLSQIVQVKNWHVAMIFLLWIISFTTAFTTLRDENDESKRRIRDLEQRPVVTEQQYEQGQQALTDRLKRIEDKLDRRH